MDELQEKERTHLRDVCIENRNHDRFQSKLTLVKWQPRWEVTDKKDTWTGEFFVTVKSVLRGDGND